MSSVAPRRVAVVAACAFPAPRGSQVLVRGVAEALAAAGHEVHLVTYGAKQTYRAPAGVRAITTAGGRGGAAPGGAAWGRLVHDVELWRLLRRVVAANAIDLIYAHNYEAPLLAYWVRARSGVPVVYHAHNALADELATYVAPGWRRRLARWVGRRLDEQIPRRADHCIALTPELGDFLQSCGVDAHRLSVLAPLQLPPVDAAGQGAPPARSGLRVMYAGNLDPYQDLDVLFDAFAVLRADRPEARLCLVTHETEWRRRLGAREIAWVEAGVIEVHVEEGIDGVWEHLRAAAVLVCPRSSWSGYPIKLINYRAAGRPIVVAAGSAKGFLDGIDALVVGNRDAGALAAAIARILADGELAARLARRARDGVRDLGDAEIAFHLRSIYGKISGVGDGAAGAERPGERVCHVEPENV